MVSAPTRFPRQVFDRGEEPDARFTLANERTFLAWIRTSLALLAGGVALRVLGPAAHPELWLVVSVLLIVLGLLTPVQAWVAWVRDERAIREGTPLSPPKLMLPLVVGVVAAGVLLLVALLWV